MEETYASIHIFSTNVFRFVELFLFTLSHEFYSLSTLPCLYFSPCLSIRACISPCLVFVFIFHSILCSYCTYPFPHTPFFFFFFFYSSGNYRGSGSGYGDGELAEVISERDGLRLNLEAERANHYAAQQSVKALAQELRYCYFV